MTFVCEKIAVDLAEVIAKQSEYILPVIVQLNDSLNGKGEDIFSESGETIKRKLHIINSYALDLTVPSIRALTNNPDVRKIYYDGEVSIF